MYGCDECMWRSSWVWLEASNTFVICGNIQSVLIKLMYVIFCWQGFEGETWIAYRMFWKRSCIWEELFDRMPCFVLLCLSHFFESSTQWMSRHSTPWQGVFQFQTAREKSGVDRAWTGMGSCGLVMNPPLRNRRSGRSDSTVIWWGWGLTPRQEYII